MRREGRAYRVEGGLDAGRPTDLRSLGLPMGALTPSPALSPELGTRYLPDETPLSMLPCRLDGTNFPEAAGRRPAPAVAARRLFILGGTVAITAAGAVEMYDV